MLNLRSPGARATGNLIESKPARANTEPRQRALGKIFGPPQQRALNEPFASPEAIAPFAAEAPFIPPFQPDALDLAGLPTTPSAEPSGSGGGIGGAGGGGINDDAGGGIDGGGGGAVGGGGGFEEGTTSPGLPVAAVPEPGAWLLMIVAFGLCGFMLRRQRRPDPTGPLCHSAP